MNLSHEEIKRYSRHLIMPEFGSEAQEKLKDSSVLMIGAGGLGCPLALYLAAAGVGKIGLVDFDTVDYSNLHRQVLYSEADVGEPKAEVAKRRIADVNPHVEVQTYNVPFKSENAMQIAEGYDILIDGTDNFPTRYLVNDVCVLTGRTNVFGSIFRFDGQVTVFDAKNGPCYRCLYPDPPPPGMVPSCAEGGVLGILPGIVGVMQATEAIKVLTGIGEPLVGRLTVFDALKMKFRELKIRKDPSCPVCSAKPTVTELIDYEEFCGVPVDQPDSPEESDELEITVGELSQHIAKGTKYWLLDVRNPNEWDICKIEADNMHYIPLPELEQHLSEIPQDEKIITICHHGRRSLTALETLKTHGITNVKSLRGGVDEWAAKIEPAMARY